MGRIGGGAYGEVYLSRTVTGMYRAVKVVRREDFEFERTFEREFEGIQKYEKVSQDHPGLVDVLHVGRDDEAGFYYYVMELADDEDGFGEEIDVESYKPRTLSSDLRKHPGRSVSECVNHGVSLAGALGHLHQAGLTHRDVKPSNIIFVKGKPKLADVGLVASSGQRTYVGTEGYVPPEGPGTSSADLYSLAMVLYEMHTGKDRLDFPELPTNLEIPPTVNRDEWRLLNGVICRAGSPDPRKRYESAHVFAKALAAVTGLETGETKRSKSSAGKKLVLAIVLLTLFAGIGYGGYWLWKDNASFLAANGGSFVFNKSGDEREDDPRLIEEVVVNDAGEESGDPEFVELPDETDLGSGIIITDRPADPETENGKGGKDDKGGKGAKEEDEAVVVATPVEEEVAQGQVKIMSQPSNASVFINGKDFGRTETRLFDLDVGPVEVVVKKEGYLDWKDTWDVKEGFQMILSTLVQDRSPVPGEPWVNSLGIPFLPEGERGHYLSTELVSVAMFDQFAGEVGKEYPRTASNGIAFVSDYLIRQAFCEWVTEKDRQAGYLKEGWYYRPVKSESELDHSFRCYLDNDAGVLILNSTPEGADVFLGEKHLGVTPLVYNEMRRGQYAVDVFLPGYEVATVTGEVDVQEPIARTVELIRDASVIYGQPWRNSQNMELVPVGGLMVAAFETRLSDFREFRSDGENGIPFVPIVGRTMEHPVAGVDLAGAVEFCEWLTRKERALNLIRPWQRYRIPTDTEWSRFAGITGEKGTTPEERSFQAVPGYPWGTEWPPPEGAGNYSDQSAANLFGGAVIEGYNDRYDRTSPVGSFPPTESGLYDIGGNVWEWVTDPYNGEGSNYRVLRGGGWNTYDKTMLESSYRNVVPAEVSESYYGFRYVLEDTGRPEE
ncbi:MAG: SUMF1/EgtB/PvdO family nonheme iron enzyme [Verrucomicrobiales bacterium]|nr:SUMF1/EgtB/PvdO family nonheme iron enzyme [Verrucomicrobiales bacterium]